MEKQNNGKICRVLVVVSYVAMVTMNALANILPINNITTGDVSDSYPNLFAPAGITFSIWGVIYILLLGYAVYQTGVFSKDKAKLKKPWMEKVGFYFVLSSVANAIWILTWHYDYIALSLVLMAIILFSLIMIMLTIGRQVIDRNEKIFVRLPFSVYFGWITVATIANVTTLLVSSGWDAFGIAEPVMTALVISVGVVIGGATIIRNTDPVYGLTLIWAYAGIIIKHLSETGFNGEYPGVVITTAAGIFIFVLAGIYVITRRKKTAL